MGTPFKTIGLMGKYQDPSSGPCLHKLARVIHELDLDLILETESASYLDHNAPTHRVMPRDQMGQICDLIIVLGGDGTLLGAARTFCFFGVPLLGINMGRLGFLANVSLQEIETVLPEMLAGQYEVDQRTLLLGSIWREGHYVLSNAPALNDIVVHKGNFARMVEFDTYINDTFAFKLRSDGLIVSTPTGSTAYALSAGGPIMHPGLGAMLLVPICPHTMSNRPLVIPDTSMVRICINDLRHNPAQVSFDGHSTINLCESDQIHIARSPCSASFIHPLGSDHYQLLRQKLHWAEQIGDD